MRCEDCASAWVCGEGGTMTRSFDDQHTSDLLDLAVPYALHAVSDAERDEIEAQVADAGLPVADAFMTRSGRPGNYGGGLGGQCRRASH